jgi:hypothetical protein
MNMAKKERFIGLRLTGALAEALETYSEKEERSRSSAVRYLLARELERLGFLSSDNISRDKRRQTDTSQRKLK